MDDGNENNSSLKQQSTAKINEAPTESANKNQDMAEMIRTDERKAGTSSKKVHQGYVDGGDIERNGHVQVKTKSSSKNSGRNLSLVLFPTTIALALILQYWGAESMDTIWVWTIGCDERAEAPHYGEICRGNAMVLRFSFALTLYYLILAVICKADPDFQNRQISTKLIIITCLLIACIFSPNYIFDTHGFAWIARIGGFFYIIFQQINLIDIAYNYNDRLYNGEPILGISGTILLILGSVAGFAVSITGWVLMYIYFNCGSSIALTTVTVIGTLICLGVQLGVESEKGTLFTTSVVTCYATYLCYSAISLNPRQKCNPLVSEDENVLQIVLGLFVVAISVLKVCYDSSNSVRRLNMQNKLRAIDHARTDDLVLGGDGNIQAQASNRYEEEVTQELKQPLLFNWESQEHSCREPDSSLGDKGYDDEDPNGVYWKSNLMLAFVAMYFGMTLTGWATISTDGTTTNQKQGDVAMYLQITAQWLAMLLYLWTVIAPKLFPDRDFS